MDQIVIPSKQQVRDWLRNRIIDRSPLPSREKILLDLGWKARESKIESQDLAYSDDILQRMLLAK